MKYYVYGNNSAPKIPGNHPFGYLGEHDSDYDRIKYILRDCEDKYINELKVKPWSGFKNILVYREKLSKDDIKKYHLTYIGEATRLLLEDKIYMSMLLQLNDELRADRLDLKLTDVELKNLINYFEDIKKYDLRPRFRYQNIEYEYDGDDFMLRATMKKIERILDEYTRAF